MAHMYRIMRNSHTRGTECVKDRLGKEEADQIMQVLNATKMPTDSYFTSRI